MVASSNSMEVGILGLSKEQQWKQWTLGDAARAELPLSPKKQDTLPVGLTVDIGTKSNTPWGENTLPPSPLLYLMSHFGVLCCFHIVNVREGAASICQIPEMLPENNGLKYFTKENSTANEDDLTKMPAVVPQQQIQQVQQQQQQQLNVQLQQNLAQQTQPQPQLSQQTQLPFMQQVYICYLRQNN